MSNDILQTALGLAQAGKINEAVEQLKPLLESEEQNDDYYKGLKLYADIIGPMTGSDNVLAIDLYQRIINEAESDELYNAAQVAILKSDLMLAMHFMEAFENTLDIIEVNEQDKHFIDDLVQKREAFITKRAEVIYKQRL